MGFSDIFGAFDPYSTRSYEERFGTDQERIASDWRAIGDDMRKVMGDMNNVVSGEKKK